MSAGTPVEPAGKSTGETSARLPQAYQIKILLVDSEPEVWRRVLVPPQVSLLDLHAIFQQAMGWENQHEWLFRLGVGPASQPVRDTQQTLAQLIATAAEQAIYYLYDFQAGWLHRLELEALEAEVQSTEAEDSVRSPSNLPACIAGAAACPPENTGGVWGYDELLARLEDPDDPEYLDLIERYSDFNPDYFDLKAACDRVKSLAQ